MDNIQQIIMCGDIHGKFGEFSYKIKNYKIENSIICCAGDIGMGFHKFNYYLTEFTKISKQLKNKNNLCFFVRGNHDDPKYFNGEYADKLNKLSNIKFVSDYEVINTPLGNIIFIGGGTSIDRMRRVYEKTYWPNEKCVFDENKLKEVNTNINIDYVITHTAPSFCYPQDKSGIEYWLLEDSNLEKDIIEEREVMDKIFKVLESNNIIKYWGYGHFHCFQKQRYECVNFVVCDELMFFSLE